MKIPKAMPFLFCLLFIAIVSSSWGFYAHKLINQTAIFTLPSELAYFYKKHNAAITAMAIEADKRCYVDSNESPRHYIDIDDYAESIDSIPIHWSVAKEKFQERNLIARGIIPWQIFQTYNRLINAFKNKDAKAILRHSADLGHYIADAHVPLHTTKNYNGQYTNQVGIHAFWESQLPEMFAKSYSLRVGKASYLNDPLQVAWDIVKGSHSLIDSVLLIEKELSQSTKSAMQKSYSERNNILVYRYSDYYARKYHEALNGMVEQRMKASILMVGNFWLSAWVDAGQPNLKNLSSMPMMVKDSIEVGNISIIDRSD